MNNLCMWREKIESIEKFWRRGKSQEIKHESDDENLKYIHR